MKKFISGLVAGIILATSFTAFADSLMGKKVDGTFPLKINGQRAPKDVITIEGTSYLPVRAAGDMFGYKVDFVNWEVTLDNIGVGEVTYRSKTSLPELADGVDTLLLNRDGEDYAALAVFGKGATFEQSSFTINLYAQTVTIPYKQIYQPGVNGFELNDRYYIKVSTFGLKATPNGTDLVIEKR